MINISLQGAHSNAARWWLLDSENIHSAFCIRVGYSYVSTGDYESQKRTLDTMKMELQAFVSWILDAGNQINIL